MEQTPFKQKILHDPIFLNDNKQYDRYCLVERKREPKKRLGGWEQVYRKTGHNNRPVFILVVKGRVIKSHEKAS